jgi:hypothetical protein
MLYPLIAAWLYVGVVSAVTVPCLLQLEHGRVIILIYRKFLCHRV